MEVFINTKEVILKKARKLFAKHGFDGVSIRNICDKVNCNVSAISYHFGSKGELYHACLKEEGKSVMVLIQSVLTDPEDQADFKAKLKLFIDQFFEHSYNNREAILIISKDAGSKSTMKHVENIFNEIPLGITAFLEAAQKKGIIREDLDVGLVCSSILDPIFMKVLFADLPKNIKRKDINDPVVRHEFVCQQADILTRGLF